MVEHKTCQVNGKQTHYWIYNPEASVTIVAIHGLRGTHHGLAFIAAALPQYRFIIPDLPGHGASDVLDSTHSIDHFTHWAAAFIQQLKLASGFVVLGHSFGTIIVSKLAQTHPELVAKLILINPIAAHAHPVSTFAAKRYYDLARWLPERVGTHLLRSRLVIILITRRMLTSKQKTLKKRVYDQHFAHFASFATRRSAVEAFRASVTDSVANYTAHLTMPTLIIAGAKDMIVPLESVHKLNATIKGSQLKIIEHVGHLVHYENPHEIAHAVTSFIETT